MAVVWQYQQKAEPLATAATSGALTEAGIVGFLPRQPALVPGLRRADPGWFTFVADSTPIPVATPTRPLPLNGDLPPRAARRPNVGDASGFTFTVFTDLRQAWPNATSQPTYRKRQQDGTYAEPLEPSLREKPPGMSWTPRLAIPPRRRISPVGESVGVLTESLYRGYVTAWMRPTNPVPTRAKRPTLEANVWRWHPETLEAPLLAPVQNPRLVRRPTISLATATSLIIPYEVTPDALTPPPGNPILRPYRPDGLIVRAIPPRLIWNPFDWWNRGSQPTYRKRSTPGHIAELDGWDVRPVAYPPTNPVPGRVRRRHQPTHYGEYIDGYRYLPLPPHQLPQVARRLREGHYGPALVPVPYEAFPAAWQAIFPDRLDPRDRPALAGEPVAYPIIGWQVYPSQFAPTLQDLPGRRRPLAPHSGAVSDIYPSWEVPLAGWWRMTETPPQKSSQVIRWTFQQSTTGQVYEWTFDGTGRLIWRADDPGNTWRWERDMGFTRPVTLAKKTTWSRVYYFDFGAYAERQASDPIASAAVTSTPSGLTVGTPSTNADKVQVSISGGQRGTTYALTCTVTMQSGAIISQQGCLSVE